MEDEPTQQSIDQFIEEWAPDIRERYEGEDYGLLRGAIAQIASTRKAKAEALEAKAINEQYNPTQQLRIKNEL
ncbi:hypothetical protein KA047_00755 [Candidatus Saccharibacteria bacterium]|nr:hypothetical protein [Candidatus Saccharibacteria bacterium]